MYILTENYAQKMLKVKQSLSEISLKQEIGYQFGMNIFSANFQNFFPEIPENAHEQMFQDSLLHKKMMFFDEEIINLPDFSIIQGDLKSIQQNFKTAIYCCFHLGSYQSLFPVLVKNGINQNLLVGEDVFKSHAQIFKDRVSEGKEYYKVDSSFDVVNGEDKTSILKVLRGLKDGCSLVTYLDGNTGVGGNHRQDEKMIKIDFLNQKIFVRKGISYLSHVSNTPIIPILTYRNNQDINVIEILEPIVPSQYQSRDEYIQQSTQLMYKHFEHYVSAYPAQWEAWNYVHKFLDLTFLQQSEEVSNLTADASFNSNRFSLTQYERDAVIFDKKSYLIHTISDFLYEHLHQFKYKKIDLNDLKTKIGLPSFHQLLDLKIIT